MARLRDLCPNSQEIESLGATRRQSVILLVDGENISGPWRLDFKKLQRLLVKDRELVAAHWFDSYRDERELEKKNAFYHSLRSAGYIPHPVPLKLNGSDAPKSMVDPHIQRQICEHLLKEEKEEAPCSNVWVLVSGDKDFAPWVELLQQWGRRVEIAAFRESLSNELRNSADAVIDLEDHWKDIAFDPTRPRHQAEWNRPSRPPQAAKHLNSDLEPRIITVNPADPDAPIRVAWSLRSRLRRTIQKIFRSPVSK